MFAWAQAAQVRVPHTQRESQYCSDVARAVKLQAELQAELQEELQEELQAKVRTEMAAELKADHYIRGCVSGGCRKLARNPNPLFVSLVTKPWMTWSERVRRLKGSCLTFGASALGK
mmetsp:Transcript_19294/g.36175  ORF Transcript_19294/g.36175 Transcript_19294/m.36175 type:complete len:117 (+) Transcript_19294:327-677(+)